MRQVGEIIGKLGLGNLAGVFSGLRGKLSVEGLTGKDSGGCGPGRLRFHCFGSRIFGSGTRNTEIDYGLAQTI
jgi:hypothetical protein